MGLAEGVIEGAGQMRAVKPNVEEVGGGLRETGERMVAAWRQRGEAALEVLRERFNFIGLRGETERVVRKRELSDEVGMLVNAMRVIANRDEEQFIQWLGEVGLTDVEVTAIRGVVEAIGSKEDMVLASRDLAEVVGGKLRMFSGGEDLEKIMWNVGNEMKKEVDGSDGESRDDFWGRGGESAMPEGPEKPNKGDEDEDKAEKDVVEGGKAKKKEGRIGTEVRRTIARLKKGIVIGRQHPSSRIRGQPGSGLAGCFLAAAVFVCLTSSVGVGLYASGVTEEARTAEVSVVDERFISVMGDKLASEALVERMFWEEEAEDPGHKVIEMFLRTYDTATPDVRTARGESMLEELGRQGLLWGEGGAVGIDEEGWGNRLRAEGYAEEEVNELIKWSRQYLQDRDELLAALQGS